MEMTTITLRVPTDFRDKVKVRSGKLEKTMMQFIIETVETSLRDLSLRKSEASLLDPDHVHEDCREREEEFWRMVDFCKTMTSPEFRKRISQLMTAEEGFLFLIHSNSWRSLDFEQEMTLHTLARHYDNGIELENSRPASSVNVVYDEVKNDDGGE